MEVLADECARLGVHRIRFIRLQPIGDAAKAFAPDMYLTQADLEAAIIPTFEQLKQKLSRKLYLCFAVNFGPNFYGKSLEAAREKLPGGHHNPIPRTPLVRLSMGNIGKLGTEQG
jgi:hypothetical protein